MNAEIQTYNNKQATADKAICTLLATTIDRELTKAESKIWHAHPVFILLLNKSIQKTLNVD